MAPRYASHFPARVPDSASGDCYIPAAEDRSQREQGRGKASPNALMQLLRGSCAPPRCSDGRCLDRMADVRMQSRQIHQNNRRLKNLLVAGLNLLGRDSATVAYGSEWLRRRKAKRWSSRSSRTGVCATHKYSDIAGQTAHCLGWLFIC